MQSLLKHIDKCLALLLITLMALLVVDVSWQVFTRFVMQSPSSYTEEVARFLLVWIGLLGASYAFRQRAHLGLDIATRALPPHSKCVAEIVALLCCAVFAGAVMVFGGARLMLLTLELNQLSAALGVKIGYIYSVIPLSGVLIIIFALDFISQSVSAFTSSQSTTTPTESTP